MKTIVKRNTFCLLLFLWVLPASLSAALPWNCIGLSLDAPCWQWQECLKAPDYYCDCRDAVPFRYGLDTVISDTTWFSATLKDVNEGLTAYWFADNAVTFDVFFACTQDTVSMSFTIGRNSAYDVDIKEIEEKLQKYGDVVGGVASALTVRIRVAPRGGVAGRAILMPYSKGPHSVCADPLPLCLNIPYVSSDPDNVYRFMPMAMPKPMLVRWVQKNCFPASVEVTYGTCDGEIVATALLADSSKVWLPDLALLQQAYAERQPLFFHFYSQHTGRIRFISPFATDVRAESRSVCQGKGLQLADTTLMESTVYCDTVYLVDPETAEGKLWFNTINLTVVPPLETEHTIELQQSQFPYLYRGQTIVRDYGDYNVLISEDNKCDEQILLHVVRPVSTALAESLEGVTLTPALAHVGQPIVVEGVEQGTLRVISTVGTSVLVLPLSGTTEFTLPLAGQYIVQIQTLQGFGQTRIIIL